MSENIRPEAVHTPRGYQRIKRGVPLKKGDLFMDPQSMHWQDVCLDIKYNLYRNCIRPVHPLTIGKEWWDSINF